MIKELFLKVDNNVNGYFREWVFNRNVKKNKEYSYDNASDDLVEMSFVAAPVCFIFMGIMLASSWTLMFVLSSALALLPVSVIASEFYEAREASGDIVVESSDRDSDK